MNLSYHRDDILNCAQLSPILEVSAYPKPGNVHRTSDYQDTRFEHFLVSAVVIRKSINGLCNNIQNLKGEKLDYSRIRLGRHILTAVKQTKKWQSGGNTNLGAILLLIPLCAASCLLLSKDSKDWEDLRFDLDSIIKGTTYKDTLDLYKAIEIANPGGLGKVDEFDVKNEQSMEKIRESNANLYEIFELTKDRDSIAKEWVSRFKITFEIGLPYFQDIFQKSHDINITIVNTFLKIVSEVPDTLIIRKHGKKVADQYSKKAKTILERGGLLETEGRELLIDWDKKISDLDQKVNPGTTADLTISTIFAGLLSGIRF
ncbi:MAG: ATP--dephospho-CoA triphosphoribosyl transferase CitG [Candidatus Lokiarchaeota archaeon]|nr:ATP--dephospho-CoA triphosphoribosyl transferase CitG [Candidatus Lokiarchaeota archaeon]